MLHELVFQIQHRSGPTDEQDTVPVVQHPYLIRGQQFSAAHLEVGGVGTGAPLRLPMGLGVDGGLAQGLRNVLVGTALVTAKVEKGIRVAGDGFPRILIQFLDLRHVLDDGAARNISGAHGCQFPWQTGQIDRWSLVQNKVDMARQRPMVDLVGTVVQRLEYLGVQQADKKIESRIIIRDHGIEGTFFLSQGIQVHVIMIGDGLDLRQIEWGQPHGGAYQNTFRCLARNELSRTFYQKNKQQYYLLHYACCVCHLAV